MCTVSFMPKSRSFYLAMNRDEKRSRATALPPAIVDLTERHAIFPREPDGGTWIAVNDAGICLALINWHRIEREPVRSVVSRGQVVAALAGKSSAQEIIDGFANLPLPQLRPFRLIVVVPSEEVVLEFRWNLELLQTRRHAWEPQHWFSSGYDEWTAEAERSRTCAAARGHSPMKNLTWLRRLHRSHKPKRGPFSICMHRSKAATVSYAEVAVSSRRVVMHYKNGPPCAPRSTMTKSLALRL
jgi:hypothetical protein